MNCDTAFELMTDAGGCQSAALAQHLDGCPRCRQMQETLSPALGFLAPAGWGSAAHELAAERDEASGSAGRQPFVTLEALAVAREAASALAARTETRPGALNSFTVGVLRYAAIFAAGILLGLVFLEQRDQPSPQRMGPLGKECTRHAAGRDEISRSGIEIQRLALSCAACHDLAVKDTVKPVDNRATLLDLDRSRELDWLAELFREERLVAVDAVPGIVQSAAV
jgi:hypothetical protein